MQHGRHRPRDVFDLPGFDRNHHNVLRPGFLRVVGGLWRSDGHIPEWTQNLKSLVSHCREIGTSRNEGNLVTSLVQPGTVVPAETARSVDGDSHDVCFG